MILARLAKHMENHVSLDEGSEPEDFWVALAGHEAYSSIKEQMDTIVGFNPRLFNISNRSGYTYMREVPGFTQYDMLTEDCYILDVFSTVYIWIGAKSNKFERYASHKKAQQYIDTIVDGRDKAKCNISEV